MNEQIKVVLVEPGKFARIEQIEKGLESYQKIVGGWIEQVCPFDDPVAIVCNEEGKIDGLPLNRALVDEDDQIYDILAGTFFICGLGEEDYCSLTDELADKYLKLFQKPESFFRYPKSLSYTRIILEKEFEV